jgi:hypothetical protein
MSGFWEIHDRLQLTEAAFGLIVDGPSSTQTNRSSSPKQSFSESG